MKDVWPIVHAERAALTTDLEGVDDEAWEMPSLCEGWTVRDVAAHLVHSASETRFGFVTGLLRARFDFDRQNERGIVEHRGVDPSDTLRRMRAVESRRSTPPAPLDSRFVEAIVHGEDIRRPLGIAHAYPTDAVVRALRLQARTSESFGGAKELMRLVTLRATDADVSVGEGPLVEGPALSLLLVATGRDVAIDELDGSGIEVLKGR